MKKLLSILLALLLLPVGTLWVHTTEAEPLVWDGTVDLNWYDPAKTEFHLSTPAELAGLAALVNGMVDAAVTPADKILGDASLLATYPCDDVQLIGAAGVETYDTIYIGAIDFVGCTIYLDADMDLGGVYDAQTDTWSGPNWTPIGGKYGMDTQSLDDPITLETRFNGVLDGQGHTISNMYCNRYTPKGFAYSQCVGFVGYLGSDEYFVQSEYDRGDAFDYATPAAKEQALFDAGWTPAVRNLVVRGFVYARRMVGGVVGRCGDAKNGVVVESCANYCTVKNTDSKGVGGVVGSGWSQGGVIRNCFNAGNISTTYTCPMGGISGSNEMSIYNCYNVGTLDSNGMNRERGIGTHNGGVYTVANCHWLTGTANEGYYTGGNTYITVTTFEQTAETMQSAAFLDTLNASGTAFVADTANTNGGYPILYFMAADYDPDKTYTVTLTQPETGGVIAASAVGAVKAGTTVTLSNTPDFGMRLDAYYCNGVALKGEPCFTVSQDVTVTASFRTLHAVQVAIEAPSDVTVTVTKSGIAYLNGVQTNVTDYPVADGDTLYESDRLTVNAVVDAGAAPADETQEYTGSCTVTARNTDSFVVTGAGDVTISVTADTQDKSWDTLADTSWYNQTDDTFTLTTAAQLAGLAKVLRNSASFTGKTIRLGGDVDFSNTDGTTAIRYFSRIGADTLYPFTGTFDGCGYAITHFDGACVGSFGGLFGYTQNAVIKNLSITGSYTATAGTVGILAGYAQSTTVQNVTATVAVAGTTSVGGLIGSARGTTQLLDCAVFGTVTASSNTAGGCIGELGDTASLTRCRNESTVTASYYAGGLVGKSSSTGTLSRCCNAGNVVSTGSNAAATFASGGLVGTITAGTQLSECANTGSIRGKATCLGGLVGRLGSASAALSDCYNWGAIDNASTSAYACAGGLIGNVSAAAVLKNSYNAGSLSGESATLGGCFGSFQGSAVQGVYYLDSVAADAHGTAVSDAALRALADTLGLAFCKGDPYPILQWQAPTVWGDVDLSGSVTSADAAKLLRYVVALDALGDAALRNADASRDGSVTSGDASIILRSVVGLPT